MLRGSRFRVKYTSHNYIIHKGTGNDNQRSPMGGDHFTHRDANIHRDTDLSRAQPLAFLMDIRR